MNCKDLLTDKPVMGIFWKLHISPKPILSYFENKGFEITVITEKEDLIKITFLRGTLIVLVIGVEELEVAQDLKNFLDFKLPIELRRDLEIIYVLPGVNSLDPLRTFLLSANLVINSDDLINFENVYTKAKIYWNNLYRYYRQVKEHLLKGELV